MVLACVNHDFADREYAQKFPQPHRFPLQLALEKQQARAGLPAGSVVVECGHHVLVWCDDVFGGIGNLQLDMKFSPGVCTSVSSPNVGASIL